MQKKKSTQDLDGKFYYIVMLFGLKNARATYQRTMTAIFHNMMHQEMEDYVEDSMIKSKSIEGHFKVLERVFEWCSIQMNPLKCSIGMSARKFLGFLVHYRGISVDPAKATTIATVKRPIVVKEVKSFMGKGFLHQEVHTKTNLSPSGLSKLLKKGNAFI